ncbi:MAG TPA: MFS transporter, partial [Sphingomonas sp.]|nr:MFS transporter [Sphingomonas sp.]
QLWVLAAAGTLAAVTLAGLTGPAVLIALTFAIALGTAFTAPAFQATVPELVPPVALPQAVALNSLGVNIARAIGPALGGLLVALSGPAAVFALNAVSVSGVVLVLWRWRRSPSASALPPEHFGAALGTGLRYAAESPALQRVLVRSIAFFLFASALWALLPIVARRELGLDAGGYGLLLAALGCGAVAGALLLPRLRSRIALNRLTIAAAFVFAGASATLGAARSFPVALGVLFLAGAAWIAMMAALNGAAQFAVPAWVKARALAIYLLVFQGSMTAGAALWGWVAATWSVPVALGTAAASLVAALLLAVRYPLEDARPDLAPSRHWPDPAPVAEPDRGPVLVTIEYRVDPERVADFVRALAPLRRIRRRDGARQWGIHEDSERPGALIEAFTVPSWLEHLRQHERVTRADREVQQALHAFHLDPEPPRVRHWIAPR